MTNMGRKLGYFKNPYMYFKNQKIYTSNGYPFASQCITLLALSLILNGEQMHLTKIEK